MSEPTTPPAVDPLVAAACSKAGLVWVAAGDARPRALWHVWHDGAVAVVVGGTEQPDPVPTGATEVLVQVPSKDNRARLVSFTARVEPVLPGEDRWDATVFALAAQRLNTSTSVDQPAVWAESSRVLRLVPGEAVEGPGRYDDGSGAAPVPPSPATTTTWRPFHLGGRRRKRFRL